MAAKDKKATKGGAKGKTTKAHGKGGTPQGKKGGVKGPGKGSAKSAGRTVKRGGVEEKGPPPRLLVRYQEEIRPKLLEKLRMSNELAAPRLSKIVVSMGVGAAIENRRRLDGAIEDLATITGQQPVVTRARRSVSSFKLREGMEIGCKVTLRGARMWEFLDRLLSLAIPRIRDFRGLSRGGFDGRGNYSFGITEQITFPEVSVDRMEFTQGMNVTVVTTARTPEHGEALLELLGFPFVARDKGKTERVTA